MSGPDPTSSSPPPPPPCRGPAPAAGVRDGLRSPKITGRHLERLAIVSVRQSTPQQVLEHRASRARQYDLADQAVALGWPKDRVVIIDEDQGQSGKSGAHRAGFQRLLAEVSLNHVGLVLGLEMSRLARSNKDWHHLLELCAAFQTVLADQDGVYDASDPNDRLLLGLNSSFPYCTEDYTSAAGCFPEARPQPRLRAT